jgi:hypothetical protein
VQSLSGGAARPVTPEGVGYLLPATPDGQFVPSTDGEGRVRLYPIDGRGEPRTLQGLEPGDSPLRWSRDGRFVFVRRRGGPPIRIERVDLATGRSEPWREIAPADRSGLVGVSAVSFSEDGKAYAYTYHRLLSELYLADGLR